MSIPLLAARTPCEIEGRNFRRGYREPQIGKVYTIQIEVDKELWDACELVPKTATLKGVIWWEPEVVEAPQEPELKGNGHKKVSGPYRYYWEVLHDKGVQNWPDVLDVLDCLPDQVWDRLHVEFGTPTMSTVSPGEFEKWIQAKGLPEGLVGLSRKAQQIAILKQEKADEVARRMGQE